jgi:hypothetical protein
MKWDSEKFKPVDPDPCWQQHERNRTPSDWIVSYQNCMSLESMTEYLHATPITVSQFCNIIFLERQELARH